MNGCRLVLALNTMNMIRADPAVDRGIIDSAKGTDGRIRIHTQSWRTYQVIVQVDDTMKNMVVPILVSSLKALYWFHSAQFRNQVFEQIERVVHC